MYLMDTMLNVVPIYGPDTVLLATAMPQVMAQ